MFTSYITQLEYLIPNPLRFPSYRVTKNRLPCTRRSAIMRRPLVDPPEPRRFQTFQKWKSVQNVCSLICKRNDDTQIKANDYFSAAVSPHPLAPPAYSSATVVEQVRRLFEGGVVRNTDVLRRAEGEEEGGRGETSRRRRSGRAFALIFSE